MIETTSSGPRRAASSSNRPGSAASAASPFSSRPRYERAGRSDSGIVAPATGRSRRGIEILDEDDQPETANPAGVPAGGDLLKIRDALHDQRRGLGVAADELRLLRRGVGGPGHADRADRHQREVDDAPLVPVVAEEGDVLPLRDAAGAQAQGAGAHLAGELRIGLRRETVAHPVLLDDAVGEALRARERDVDERPIRSCPACSPRVHAAAAFDHTANPSRLHPRDPRPDFSRVHRQRAGSA